MNNEKLHSFAIYWKQKWLDLSTTDIELENNFGEACRSLEIKMDCGKAIEDAYPNIMPLYNLSDFKQIVDEISDVDILTSAIYSKWRGVTHWSQTSLTSHDNRRWFVWAFTRLEKLTQ